MTHSEYLVNKRDEILSGGNLSKELLDFYTDLFVLQEKYTGVFSKISSQGIDYDISTFPVISPENVILSANELSETGNLLQDLTSLIVRKNPGLNFDSLIGYFSDDKNRFCDTLRILLEKDFEKIAKIGEEIKIGRDEFIFTLINLFKPFLLSLRSAVDSEIDSSKWLKSTCPFCGFEADMAKIVESKDSKRILHCALCEYEWDFRRIYCPVCSNDNPETLGFLAGENEVFRIDYCDECKGYIKTLRIQKQFDETRFYLLVENIATPDLDASAFELGYRRP